MHVFLPALPISSTVHPRHCICPFYIYQVVAKLKQQLASLRQQLVASIMADLQIVVAQGKNVQAQYVEMMVPLYSYGCEKKIKKALSNLKGIYSVNVNFHRQKVTVWGICDKCDVLSVVQKKRKGARFWDAEEDDDGGHDDDRDHQNSTHLLQDSHSAPPSPRPSHDPKNFSTRYFAMIKGSSLRLNLSLIKTRSLNWQKALNKAFARSNSF